MTDHPYISVIASVYNTEPFLFRFLDSIVSQTFKDFEFIIIDDTSTDGSYEALKIYAKEYDFIKLIRHEHNEGIASTRQTGLENANGKYVIFLDADDYADSDMLESLYDRAVKTDADIIATDVFYDLKSQTKYVTCHYDADSKAIISSILNNTIGCAGQYTRMIKKSLFDENDISFQKGINFFEDRLIAVKQFTYASKIEKINRAFYHYVQYNDDSITKKFPEKSVDNMIDAQNLISEFLLEKDPSWKDALLDFKCYILFIVWLSGQEELTQKIISLYGDEVKKHIKHSLSIPKPHTRHILYLYICGHKKLSAFLMKLIRTVKKIVKF